MKEKIMKYIDSKSPNLRSEYHLRFELGDPYENGTDERIKQVVKRVTTLFDEVFEPDDFIVILVRDWGEDDIMFGNTTPNYLYNLLDKEKENIEEVNLHQVDKEYDDTGKIIEVKSEYRAKFVYSQVKSIPYKKILEGIGNYEQGREPSIGQSVHFINVEKDITFHMYDDRGCTINANEIEKLTPLYHTYNEWLVDYWHEYFDSVYKDV